MSRNKGQGQAEQKRVTGQGGSGTKAPTRKHGGVPNQEKQDQKEGRRLDKKDEPRP